MAWLSVSSARYEALFASGLQRSDSPSAEAVAQAIRRTVCQLGTRGCASQMAQEFGDHPEAACDRMRWVRQVISELAAAPAPQRAKSGRSMAAHPCPPRPGSGGPRASASG